MRSSFAVRTGLLRLAKTPNYRQMAARRRMIVIGAMLALAAGSAVIGVLSAPGEADSYAASGAGPFSYFPTQ
jgi:hypothetical protein